ncbi:MAG TPA: SpoIIE family protein phosphatase, partial [Leptospiraceae bacterium]|nr:SpoIIE family protein phosphatase [Leptospiraceae bacterium]
IGELGLIGEGSRSSRAVCRLDTEVCKLGKKDFLKLLEEIPAISLNVTKAVAQRQKESDLLAIEKHSILQSANRNLEQKVKERTDELNSSLQTVRKDLAFAKKIQSSLMPIGHLLTEHFQFVSHYIPMQEVGGDIFDICSSENGKLRILIADATGHGVQAALITMLIKGEYESLKKTAASPAEILKRMNSTFLERYSHVNLLFTCFIADLDAQNNMLTYCSAGHPAQILFRKDRMIFLPSTGKIPGHFKGCRLFRKNNGIQSRRQTFSFY